MTRAGEAAGYSFIKRSSEYRRVYDSGKKLPGRYYIMFYLQADDAETRVGITVSAKVGTATVRNRAKRRTRHALLPALSGYTGGGDIVLVALGRIKDAPFEALVEDIKKLLARVKR